MAATFGHQTGLSRIGLMFTALAAALALQGCGGGSQGLASAASGPVPSELVGPLEVVVASPNQAIVRWTTASPSPRAMVLFGSKDALTGQFILDPVTAASETRDNETAHSVTVTSDVLSGASFVPGEFQVKLRIAGRILEDEAVVTAAN